MPGRLLALAFAKHGTFSKFLRTEMRPTSARCTHLKMRSYCSQLGHEFIGNVIQTLSIKTVLHLGVIFIRYDLELFDIVRQSISQPHMLGVVVFPRAKRITS